MVKKQHSIRPAVPSDLRSLAEERLHQKKLIIPDQSTSQDTMMRMVHELEVHQIELEMLNEELMLSRDELVISRNKMTESLERYTELYDFAPVGYLTLAPDGRILEANLMASSILGVVRTQLRDNNVQNFFIPQSLSLFKTMLDAVFIRKERGSCEVMLMVPDPQHPQDHHDPSAHTVRLDAAVNDNGQECRVILTDITEQKKMLAELIAAKEHAEESDRLKSAFLANISHEIRTPMNGIIGFSELLKEPHLTGEEQAEYVDLIQQSGRRMLNLINDLIDISRIEAGETKLQITPTPVNKVLRDLHAFFMPAISQKKLQLRSTPGLPDAESIIETDNGKLAQILTNLLQNALKFTVTGSIDFGYTRQGTTLEFYVIDTGIGIPDKMQEKIFDRFRQVDNTLTRNHEGSGLGLSITKAYVEMLGGKLSVRSAEGAGSIFTFTLPYNPVKTSDLSSPVQPSLLNPKLSGLGTQPCILIVDDDAVSRVLLVKTLQRENMTVLTAVNGQEAIDQVRHHPEISLVLLDLQLPLLNGYEAATAIKQHRPELPVIAQSAFTSKEDKQKARQAGCNTYITKPINKTELLNLITELLKC